MKLGLSLGAWTLGAGNLERDRGPPRPCKAWFGVRVLR